MSITKQHEGQTYQATVTHVTSHSAADWIQEAPTYSQGFLPWTTSCRSRSAALRLHRTPGRPTAPRRAAIAHEVTANKQPLAVSSTIDEKGHRSLGYRDAAVCEDALHGPARQAA